MENMTLTIEQIKNAEWEIHSNVTDHNYGEGYEVYKAYIATIDDHEVKFENVDDCQGCRMYIDDKQVREEDVFEDDGENPVEVIGDMLDDNLDDLDEIRTRYMYESGACVESFTQEDRYGHEVFNIEVHSYEHPERGTVYVACIDNDPQDSNVELEYAEYDYESVLDCHKDAIIEHVEDHVREMIDDLEKSKKFVGTDEQVQAIIDAEVESEIVEYVGEYSLQYYYEDNDDYYKREETHAIYMEGGDMDEKIEALFVEKDEDEDEE